MTGYRNVFLGLCALVSTTWVALAGIKAGTDPVGLATILGAIGTTVVGVAAARALNKKYAPEQ